MKSTSFIIISLTALSFTYCTSSSQPAAKVDTRVARQQHAENVIAHGEKQISNKQVCMVNDKFMNADQIPVPIGDKTYYGCCEGCVSNLKSDTAYRYSQDPESGDKVDKAIAVIILAPGTKDQVLYFKSETSAKQYIETHSKK